MQVEEACDILYVMRHKIICPFCEVWIIDLVMIEGLCEFECLGCARDSRNSSIKA
jgi:hypothetical protein